MFGFRNLLFIVFSALLFISCSKTPNNEKTTDEKEAIPVIKLNNFTEKAGNYIDKQVKVSGIVDHVCKHGGKRIVIVTDGAKLHVDSEKRFDEDIAGKEILVTGIVREFRVDESYCLKLEEDNINSHNAGKLSKEDYKTAMDNVKFYRDSMAAGGIDHISYYSLDYVSHKEL